MIIENGKRMSCITTELGIGRGKLCAGRSLNEMMYTKLLEMAFQTKLFN